MAICNLFRTLSKETGNFMMFGQYADDLTKHHVQYHSYKVVPTKFVALDINYRPLAIYSGKLGVSKLNELLPAYLQDYFENGCAYLKSNQPGWDSTKYNPEIASNLFWNAMTSAKLLTLEPDESTEQSSDNIKILREIKYIGNIDIHSYEQKDGMGYSEIYCYIPNNAQETKYKAIVDDSVNSIHCGKEYVEGYNEKPSGIEEAIGVKLPGDGIDYVYEKKYDFLASRTKENESMFAEISGDGMMIPQLNSKSFTFNTIVVLYDILAETTTGEEVIYRDVPLGVHLTGLINDDGTVTNSVLKYTTSEDAYGSGTSYGLRICSRFAVTPNSTIILDTELELKDQYAGFSEAMISMAESQQVMNDILTQIVGESGDIKNELARFKNYRTNVPYIKEIDGVPYWFINGRCIYVPASGAPGKPGKDGSTPSISSDGYWVLGEEKSNVRAEGTPGKKGDTGVGIQSITKKNPSNWVDYTYVVNKTNGDNTNEFAIPCRSIRGIYKYIKNNPSDPRYRIEYTVGDPDYINIYPSPARVNHFVCLLRSEFDFEQTVEPYEKFTTNFAKAIKNDDIGWFDNLTSYIKNYYSKIAQTTLNDFISGDSVTLYCEDGEVTLIYNDDPFSKVHGFSIEVSKHQYK